LSQLLFSLFGSGFGSFGFGGSTTIDIHIHIHIATKRRVEVEHRAVSPADISVRDLADHAHHHLWGQRLCWDTSIGSTPRESLSRCGCFCCYGRVVGRTRKPTNQRTNQQTIRRTRTRTRTILGSKNEQATERHSLNQSTQHNTTRSLFVVSRASSAPFCHD